MPAVPWGGVGRDNEARARSMTVRGLEGVRGQCRRGSGRGARRRAGSSALRSPAGPSRSPLRPPHRGRAAASALAGRSPVILCSRERRHLVRRPGFRSGKRRPHPSAASCALSQARMGAPAQAAPGSGGAGADCHVPGTSTMPPPEHGFDSARTPDIVLAMQERRARVCSGRHGRINSRQVGQTASDRPGMPDCIHDVKHGDDNTADPRAQPALPIVLAAGEGTRMRSARPKVLHAIAGRSLLAHVLAAVAAAGCRPHRRRGRARQDDVAARGERDRCRARDASCRRERRGTAHAVLAAGAALAQGRRRRPGRLSAIRRSFAGETLPRLRAPLAEGAAVVVLGFRAGRSDRLRPACRRWRQARRHPRAEATRARPSARSRSAMAA